MVPSKIKILLFSLISALTEQEKLQEGSSTPPLKKNVTCAYFSVSAVLNCFRPKEEIYSPNVLVPSPQVATYDLQPEMSAIAVTDGLVKAIHHFQQSWRNISQFSTFF